MYESDIVSGLKRINGKKIKLSTVGFINTKMTFNKFRFEIIQDILRLYDDNNYFTFNINQIVKLNFNLDYEFITDSDMKIFIKEIKNAY